MASQQPKPLWNFDPVGGQILDPIAFYTLNQPQPPFFHVMGPNVAVDGLSSWEPQMKRPKEEVLSLDSFKIGQVSTGLGLSLDNPNLNLASSSGDSGSAYNRLSSAGGVFDRELQRMDAEIDSFIRLQGDLLRKSILEKVQAKQYQTLACFEEKFRQKIQEKELQIQDFTKRNMELEEQFRKLHHQVSMWQQEAKINEDMIDALRLKLQHAQNNREGCGDSEVDSVSCSKRAIDFQLLSNENKKEESVACKVCGVNDMCMLLLPCRHLCLCKDCEVKLNLCPVCQCSKFFGVEVYM
ncbi:probable BOI-related E3 ubiquitin-protein ligase 2 [Asparagus officinalis]|uniref:probable BOI-related E3 ubiquitin-protein ligase 2 n=1 Tax=Asparagus officinalis TaxID=4686 RepID=UPI00098E5920|nr:probable BOI-related E3 ubiquitin-protein ligase 2 [Asparagus officinalis]